MNNKEIDARLKLLSQQIPMLAESRYTGTARYSAKKNVNNIAIELELLNCAMTAVYAMLGEIAKRLPEPKEESKTDPG